MSTKSVARYKQLQLLTTQVANLHAPSYFNTKTFTALNCAQDFGTLVKRLRIRNGLHLRKVELSRVKYFHAFVSTVNYVSPISANNDKRR